MKGSIDQRLPTVRPGIQRLPTVRPAIQRFPTVRPAIQRLPTEACAAARRAMGTRNGEHET